MKIGLVSGLTVACLASAGVFAWWREAAPGGTEVRISSRVLVSAVTPFGISLGNWTSWGAEQLPSNVIKNPGFEGVIDRALVIPQHSLGGSFDDAPQWLARPGSFWDGAHYDIRTGSQAGQGGTVTHSLANNLFGLPSFVVKDGDPLPESGEVVALTKISVDALPSQWWFSGPAGSFAPAEGSTRPASPGKRALRISAQTSPVAATSYLDAIGQRAGKLLPLEGDWSLSFWVRAAGGACRLQVQVAREGSAPALSREIPLSAGWTNPRLEFSAHDDGPPGTLALRFTVVGQPSGQLLLDDVDLRRASDEGFPFRGEVVELLGKLHPRYLRDWEGQLGDTLANRIAPAFGRKAYRYRPGDNSATDFGYGLRDFLDLCLKVGADPWITVPPTFSDEEYAGLGDYLRAQPDLRRCREVILEFGNENWNEVFRPAGIPDAHLHGEAADRAFRLIRSHAGNLPLKLAVNAQHAWVERAIAVANESKEANLEAVAPYFLPALTKGTSSDEALRALFAGDGGRLRKIAAALSGSGKETAIYEVNLTTVGGTAAPEERTPIVAGVAAGSALAKTMLDALALGVRRQCVYSFSGFDTQLPSGGFVRLWGITRDLGPTRRLRPTGLALELLNKTVDGSMYAVDVRGSKDVFGYAFRSRRGWAVALVSAHPAPQQVEVQFPQDSGAALPTEMYSLDAKSWMATNEEAEDVCITHSRKQSAGRSLAVDLPAGTLAVLLPPGSAE